MNPALSYLAGRKSVGQLLSTAKRFSGKYAICEKLQLSVLDYYVILIINVYRGAQSWKVEIRILVVLQQKFFLQ